MNRHSASDTDKEKKVDAPIAQLDRAFDYESKGCGFDSCSARHCGEVAQLARAVGSYPEDRGFESHPRYLELLSWLVLDL